MVSPHRKPEPSKRRPAIYADYDFYLNTYFGNAISEEDFPRLSTRASDYIRSVTNGISDTVDGWQLEAVKKASCAVADVLLDDEIMTTGAFSGEQTVSSETVGGWSRSYGSSSVSSASAEYNEKRKTDALLLYLKGLPAFASMFGVRSYRCLHG